MNFINSKIYGFILFITLITICIGCHLSGNGWNKLGVAKGEKGDYSGAITCFDNALDINPDNYEAYYNRARAENMMGEDTAIEDLNKALIINPSFIPALTLKGYILFTEHKYKEAYSCELQLMKLQPDDPEIYAFSALILSQFGDLNEALVLAKKGLSFNSECGYCYGILATILTRKEDYNEGLININRAIELEGETSNNLFQRGKINVKLKKFEDAFNDITKAIDTGEDYSSGYNITSEYYYETGDYDTSLEYAVKAKATNPDDPDSYYFIGLNEYKFGRYEIVIQSMTKAIERKDDYVDAYYYRGLAEKELGDDDNANADFKKVEQLKPGYIAGKVSNAGK